MESAYCPACGHLNEGPIGVLGRLLWYSCRCCGFWYGKHARDPQAEGTEAPL